MKHKRTGFSAVEVARYLVDRMGLKRTIKPADGKGSLKKGLARARAGSAAKGKAAGALDLQLRLAELKDLAVEREDLVLQIVNDRDFFEESSGAATQEEILALLDGREPLGNLDLRKLTAGLSASQGLSRSVVEARMRLAEVKSRMGQLIGDPLVATAKAKEIAERVDVIRTARNVEALQGLVGKCDLSEMELLARRNSENASLTKADQEVVRKYDLIRQRVHSQVKDLMGREEIFYEVKRRNLLEYRRQLLSDGFVETASVRNDVMKTISHLQLGIPVLLRGHLGTGKTEIALHVSRRYFGQEPEFISGSEEATKYDIYGKTQIGVRPEDDKMREFKFRMDEYQKMNPEAKKKELKEIEKQYDQTIVVKGLTTSFFQYGPLVRAMKKGSPLIIDEMDGIPHSIIMRLNHVLTRRPGDRVRVQEDGGEEITVQRGFCVMATGNIKSARYKREELDAAFLSRWWCNDIYYPPQDETYGILVSSLLDRRGDLQVRDHGDLDDLKRLTEAAAEIQRIFAGEQMDYFGEGADVAREIPASLKKSVLSLRHLWNIVRPWKARNFDKPLEQYILNEFIKPSVTEDQVYLVQLFCRFRFFKTWKRDDFGIPGLTEAKLLAFQGRQKTPPGV